MKKINIVKKNEDFAKIIKSTSPFKSKNFIVYLEHSKGIYHFGISVSKKIGNAVVRNKLKRQIKNILDKKDYKNDFNCIIILKRSVIDCSYQDLEQELFWLIKKLKLEKENTHEEKN